VDLSGGDGNPERYDAGVVTTNLFGLLRVQPAMGRSFTETDVEPGAAPVVIIGHTLWRNRFASDPDIVGRTIRANGRPTTVIGVMPDGFGFPVQESLWLPLWADPLPYVRGSGPNYWGFGRLADGVSESQALAELEGIARRLASQYRASNEGVRPLVAPFVEDLLGEEIVGLGFTMLAAVFGVLLVACANVANLLLARAARRVKETAVRTALGASRARVISLLLVEALVLATAGAVLGLGVAHVAVDWFNAAIRGSPHTPFWLAVELDGTVLLFVLGITVVAALVAGGVPALQASGTDVHEVLKDDSRGSTSLHMGKFTKSLVVAEIALSCGLLVGAGLMIKTVANLREMDYGFATEDIFTARVALSANDYAAAGDVRTFYDELLRRMTNTAGVEAIALASSFPGMGAPGTRFALEGEAYESVRDYPIARFARVTPGFLAVLGVEPRQGRDFSVLDDANTMPVVIVNESFARKFAPGGDVVGRRLQMASGERPWRTIVGVVPDLVMNGRGRGGMLDDDAAGVYLPFNQSPARDMGIAMRTSGPPLALTAALRQELNALGPDQPLYGVDILADAIESQNVFYRIVGSAFTTFGLAALLLAAVGLYGVISFSVSRRVHEMGLRMALGAQGRHVLVLILRQGVAQLSLGIAIGLMLAAVLSRLMELSLYDVAPWDPVVFTSVVLTLGITGIVACFVPAQRATRVDPIVALRAE
jgi:putative ABC transport system permease protein